MASEKLDEYHHALRAAFYEQRDQELLDYLSSSQHDAFGESGESEHAEFAHLESLAGIRDPEVLQTLTQLGITTENILAFTMLPLVRMAWADNRVQDGEFEVVLKAAEEDGIREGSVNHRMLSRWLEERPSDKMIDAWRMYARALAEELDDGALEAVRHEVLGRAYRIAETSGGFLGISKITETERLVLEDLRRALDRGLP